MNVERGWRNDATAEVADGLRGDPTLRRETLERVNQLAAGLSLDEVIEEAGREVAASWFGQEPMPLRNDAVDWRQLGESFLLELLERGHELGR
jgi:hypothetical protein